MSSDKRKSTSVRPSQRQLVCRVAKAYLAAKRLPVLSAFQIDDEALGNLKWNPTSCHFVIDVRNTVLRVLEKQPNEARLLAKAWARLQVDDRVIGEWEARLISLLAPIFKALEPKVYFKTIRRRIGERAA